MKCSVRIKFSGSDITIQGYATEEFINAVSLMLVENIYLSEESFVKSITPTADAKDCNYPDCLDCTSDHCPINDDLDRWKEEKEEIIKLDKKGME